MGDLERIVVHIGMPKTGTTAIQDTLAANRELLATNEVHYPRSATRGNAHHPLAWSAALKRRPRHDVLSLAHYLESLEGELHGTSGTAILSSEALFHLPAQEMRSVLDWVRAVSSTQLMLCYIRPPAAFHEGWYRQLVKTSGYDRSFDEHLEEAPIVDSLNRLKSAESVVGRGRLWVRPYLRSSFPKSDVIEDFFSVVEIDSALLTDRLGDANPSLDVELVEFKVLLHKMGVDHSPRLASALLDWSSARTQSTRSLFTRRSWAAFVAATQRNHDELLTRYGLPHDFRDERPSELSRGSLTESKARTLLQEFRERYPSVSSECLAGVRLP